MPEQCLTTGREKEESNELVIPTRIRLSTESESISFSYALKCVGLPHKDDFIIVVCGEERETIQVKARYHFVSGDSTRLTIYCAESYQDYDGLMLAFERIKDHHTIADVEANPQTPPSYYLLYRLIAKLWGKKYFNTGSDNPVALAGILKACYLAVGIDVGNMDIELLHKLIIGYKQSSNFCLLTLLKLWDRESGRARTICDADPEVVQAKARDLFRDKIRSVTNEQLPIFLK